MQAWVRIWSFNPSGRSLCYKPRRRRSKRVFGACLRKVGISCPGRHIWHRLLMQNTWPTLLCRNKFCSHTSARLAELEATPQPLQLTKLQTNAFWHPTFIYSPLQSSSRAALFPNPLQSHEQIQQTEKIIYSPETNYFLQFFSKYLVSEHEKRCHNNSEQPLQEQLPRRHFIDASSPPANVCCQTRCLDSRNHG